MKPKLNKNGLLYDFIKNWRGYIFVLPCVLGFFIFSLYPICSSIFYSFTTYNLAYPPHTLGVYNYVKIFTSDWPQVSNSLRITFTYVLVFVPTSMVISFLLALFLNRKVKGIGIFRTLYYIPVVLPTIVYSLLWMDILDPAYGMANAIFGLIGLPQSNFLYSKDTALATVIVMGYWGAGGSLILWLSALKNVPVSLIESAKLDGASGIKVLGFIIVPMCTPIIFYVLVTSIIAAIQTFGTYFMVGGGGQEDSLMFFGVKIYLEGFYSRRFGYAAALSWVMFFIIAVFSLIMFKYNKWVYYEE